MGSKPSTQGSGTYAEEDTKKYKSQGWGYRSSLKEGANWASEGQVELGGSLPHSKDLVSLFYFTLLLWTYDFSSLKMYLGFFFFVTGRGKHCLSLSQILQLDFPHLSESQGSAHLHCSWWALPWENHLHDHGISHPEEYCGTFIFLSLSLLKKK